MPTRSAKFYSLALIFGDIFVIMAAFSLAYVLRVQIDNRPLLIDIYARDFFITLVTIVPLWILVFASLGLYKSIVYSRRLIEWSKLLIGTFIGILIIIGYAFVIDEPVFPARLVAVYAFVASFILLVVVRELIRQVRGQLWKFGIGISRVLIVGNSPVTRDVAEQLSYTERSGYQIVAIAGPKRLIPKKLRLTHYPTLHEALNNLGRDRITTIIQTDLYAATERNQQVLTAAQQRHIAYTFIPGESEFYSGKNTVDIFLGYPIIAVHQTPLIGWGEVAKRIFDVALTIITLPIWGSLLLLIALLQKIFNPGPVFYVAPRLTRYSKRFGHIKFRSMDARYGKKDAAIEFRAMGRNDLAREYEKYRKVTNDPRITRFGHFLRNTSLDELPQLLNVLRGDLSLVGPRPILPQELHWYKGRGALLHSVKSGVTGLWQVSGRSDLPFEQRVELELYYAQNWSFWLDIKILFKTIRVVFFRDGAR